MRTKIAVMLALAFAGLTGAAMAATKPSHPATPANTNANSKANATSTTGTSSNANANSAKPKPAKVTFVIRGTVTAYTAANGTTNGSISITFASSNRASAALKAAAQPLTFAVASSTKIAGTIAVGDKVSVKVRAAKDASAATLTTLTATQIVEQGSDS